MSRLTHSLSRRTVLLGASAVCAEPWLSRAASAAKPVINVTLPTPGSAGSIWRAAVSLLPQAASLPFDINWIVADPGQMQVQLAAGALDVGVFGAVGLAALAEKRSDITLFGPGLNNHGRIVVRADSPYRKPSDLLGKKIATQPRTTETYQAARVALSMIDVDLNKDVEVIFGPPTANLALFDRGDVEAVIVVEPTATRAVGNGARELARIADIWKQGSGLQGDPFLVGLAAKQSWLDANRQYATTLARLFADANAALRHDPQLFVKYAGEMGVRPAETAAAALLPTRLADVYPSAWDAGVWAVIDRQVEVAAQLGILAAVPKRRLYDGIALGSA